MYNSYICINNIIFYTELKKIKINKVSLIMIFLFTSFMDKLDEP